MAAAAVIGILVIAVLRQRTAPPTPVAIASVPAPQASSAQCTALTAALPETLGEYQRAPAAEPAPAGAAAWRSGPDAEPVVLRCGLDRPTDFVMGSPLQQVNSVQWFQVVDMAAAGRSTWFAVDRPVYVALTLPDGSGPTPIQQLSDVIDQTMPAVRPTPGPVG